MHNLSLKISSYFFKKKSCAITWPRERERKTAQIRSNRSLPKITMQFISILRSRESATDVSVDVHSPWRCAGVDACRSRRACGSPMGTRRRGWLLSRSSRVGTPAPLRRHAHPIFPASRCVTLRRGAQSDTWLSSRHLCPHRGSSREIES